MARERSRRDFVRQTAAGASGLAMALAHPSCVGAGERVRLGWIGVGGRGTSLLKRALTIPEIEPAALCDLVQERVDAASAVAAEGGYKPKTYSDFRTMLEKEKLDGVIVAVEIGNHRACVVPVLDAGLHCFSEKPMGRTVEDIDTITETARKAKGIYQVGFQRRYNPGTRECVEAIQDGGVGRVNYLEAHWHWSWEFPQDHWVMDMDVSGGLFAGQACHHLDVFAWIKGGEPPVSCVSMGAANTVYPAPPAHQSEDKSVTGFTYADGALLAYTHLFCLPKAYESEKMIAAGDTGVVDIIDGTLTPRVGEPRRVGQASPDYDGGTRNELAGFVESIQTGKQPRSNAETGRVASLMGVMAHQAMYDRKKHDFTPRVVRWKDLGSAG